MLLFMVFYVGMLTLAVFDCEDRHFFLNWSANNKKKPKNLHSIGNILQINDYICKKKTIRFEITR